VSPLRILARFAASAGDLSARCVRSGFRTSVPWGGHTPVKRSECGVFGWTLGDSTMTRSAAGASSKSSAFGSAASSTSKRQRSFSGLVIGTSGAWWRSGRSSSSRWDIRSGSIYTWFGKWVEDRRHPAVSTPACLAFQDFSNGGPPLVRFGRGRYTKPVAP
jgi:hypothetical protein